MLVLAPLLLALLPLPVAATTRLQYQTYANNVISGVQRSADGLETSHFALWIQLAKETMIPLIKTHNRAEGTVIVPNSRSFMSYITGLDGDTMDPESMLTPSWKERWNGVFPFLFFETPLNTVNATLDETIVLDSYLRSSTGDWPLRVAFRKDSAYDAEIAAGGNASVYNGTFYFGPYGEANISVPDSPANLWLTANLVNGWPVQPTALNETIGALSISGWEDIVRRLPQLKKLQNQQNFTLFLPPTAALTEVLAGNDSSILNFVNAHLVQPERVMLSPSLVKRFISVGGSAVQVGSRWIASEKSGINATVLKRDILTDGGVIQVIDRALI